MGDEGTLVAAAVRVLQAASAEEKSRLTREAVAAWRSGRISRCYGECDPAVPLRPARDKVVKIVAPGEVGRCGASSRPGGKTRFLLHNLVHIESWAVDLAWDAVARFGARESMPRAFFDDFVRVAEEEDVHFGLLKARLEALGGYYGESPAHEGLWESAEATSGSLLARVAVEHCVHEARGLDRLPSTIARFERAGDAETARVLKEVVYPEEVTHCAVGLRWFRFLLEREEHGGVPGGEWAGPWAVPWRPTDPAAGRAESPEREAEVARRFREVVAANFHGALKPPFNAEARRAAGFTPEFYEPLA